LFVCIFSFNTLLKLTILVQEPYGTDSIDYDLDYDLLSVWNESLDVAKSMKHVDAHDAGPACCLADKVLAGARATKALDRVVLARSAVTVVHRPEGRGN
jgi:hypothetical protein